jgi:hypothetical protein
MGYLPLPMFYFIFSRTEVCHELVSIPIIKRGREGSDLRVSISMRRLDFASCFMVVPLPSHWI